MKTQEQIQQVLTTHIHEELLSGETLEADDSLLEGGIVDSLGVVRLANFIDEEFDVQVPPSDFTKQNFESLRTLAAYVSRRLEPPS